MAVLHSAPKFASNEGVIDAISETISVWLIDAAEAHGEVIFRVRRDDIARVLQTLRDDHQYQQLMEIAGSDYPERAERFEVVYMLQSLTKNHRVMVKCSADESTPVPTVTMLWPNAGWLEREVFDMYGADEIAAQRPQHRIDPLHHEVADGRGFHRREIQPVCQRRQRPAAIRSGGNAQIGGDQRQLAVAAGGIDQRVEQGGKGLHQRRLLHSLRSHMIALEGESDFRPLRDAIKETPL
jgi:Ni,Fe-hydrogenase III component G